MPSNHPRHAGWLQPKRPHHSSSMQTKATTSIVSYIVSYSRSIPFLHFSILHLSIPSFSHSPSLSPPRRLRDASRSRHLPIVLVHCQRRLAAAFGLVAHKTHHQPLGIEVVNIQLFLFLLLFPRTIVFTSCFQSPHNLICNAPHVYNGSTILDLSEHFTLFPT